jgi:hypothetical protein
MDDKTKITGEWMIVLEKGQLNAKRAMGTQSRIDPNQRRPLAVDPRAWASCFSPSSSP